MAASYGEILAKSLEELRSMVDSNTVIGTPIHAGEGITLIPVSRISFAVISGGGDFNQKDKSPAMGIGIGSGVNVVPVAFVVISSGNVRIVPIGEPASTTVDRIIEVFPDVFERVKNSFKKDSPKDSPRKNRASDETGCPETVAEPEVTE
jgi:sporulation protein YtfJ